MKHTRDLKRDCPLNDPWILGGFPSGFPAEFPTDSRRIPSGFLNGFRADFPAEFQTDSETDPYMAEGHRGWSKNDYGMGVVTHATRVTTHTIRLGAVLLAGGGDHPTRHEIAQLRAVLPNQQIALRSPQIAIRRGRYQ